MDTYYKVFSFDKYGRLYSSNRNLNPSGLSQRYYLTRTNYPKFDYPIFAFTSLEAARRFSILGDDFLVAKVTGEVHPIPLKLRLAVFSRAMRCIRDNGGSVSKALQSAGILITLPNVVGLNYIDSIKIV